MLPGSAFKLCVVVMVRWVGVESEFSDRLWLELSLGQAEHYLTLLGTITKILTVMVGEAPNKTTQK